MKIIEIAEYVEEKIERLGGRPAFPVNVSINEIAAHYTPVFNDTREVKEGEIVKVDIGVQVDGYIGDTALSWCSEKNELIETASKALDAAIRIIRPGTSISEIGSVIEEEVKKHGFGLIVNLTGHGLDQYIFHGHPTVPNVKNNSNYVLKENDVIAIEPFVAKTTGYVKESGITEIYRYLQDKGVRLPEARKILEMGRDEYKAFPFAKRWLIKRFSPIKVSLALRQLEAVGAIETYPVLKEIGNKPIEQAEHTIIVLEKPIITTKLSE